MFSTRPRIKMYFFALLSIFLFGFVSPARAVNTTLIDNLKLRASLEAQIVVLTAEIAQLNAVLFKLQVIAGVDPNVQGLITNVQAAITNNQKQLTPIQQKHAVVVQLTNAQIRLRELQIQLNSAERRTSRIDSRLAGHPILERIAERRLQRLNSIRVNDTQAIRNLEVQIASLEQQLATLQSGG